MPTPLSDTTSARPDLPDEWTMMVKLCERLGVDIDQALPSRWGAMRAFAINQAFDRIEAMEARTRG